MSEDVFTGTCGEPCERIRVEELVSGDTFDSHDGLAHRVEAVAESDDGRTVVNVRCSDGTTYSVEFEPGSTMVVRA